MVATESDSELSRGDVAPDFDLPAVDGGTYSLDDFADRDALLVVFTCNHCPYARAKFDLLNDVAAEYDDCAVVGINPNDAEAYPEDSFERMVEYVEDGRVAYDAYLRDESQAVARAYGAVCTPDPFLFANGARSDTDEGGEVAGADGFELAYHGRLDDALNPDDEPQHVYVRDAIDAVLAGDPVPLDDLPSRGCSIKWRS